MSNGGTSVLRHSAQAVDEADMFDTVWAAFLMLLATHDFIESSASQSHFAFSHAVITILNLASQQFGLSALTFPGNMHSPTGSM